MSEEVHDLLNGPVMDVVPRPDGRLIFGDFPLDENIIACFPNGTKVFSAGRFGASEWTITARINVGFLDGAHARYFVKCAAEERGRVMMEGEYNAMSELYKTMPEFVPRPICCGRYRFDNPETYYFLSDFIDMSDGIPEPDQLCYKLAQLHKNSVSPTGKFGLQVTTCQGRTPQAVSWESSWTRFFSNLLRHVTDLDQQTNGYWDGLGLLERRIFECVIPRLIGALERDGRIVKPCLIHADLWEGNIGTSNETGDIYIFDSGAYYAHNEMEIGDWRCHYNKIHDEIYTNTYLQYYEPSEPKEEWDDRNRMYSIYYNVIYSINHMAEGQAVRQIVYDDMYYLIDKYASFAGCEGPPRLKASDRALLSTKRDHTKT